MKRGLFALLLILVASVGLLAQTPLYAPLLGENGSNATPNGTPQVFVTISSVDSPWGTDSKICVFIREWILKGVFIIIFLVFLLGVATISGAAFPEWRNYGSKMIMGSLGAVILYILGSSALRFFMGVSVCGL